MRKGVYGTNLEAVWSLQSEVRKDHIQYHEDLDETRTTRKEYNRSQKRAVAQFKEVTKRDDRQKRFYHRYSFGLFPEQHGELIGPASKWEETEYTLVFLINIAA